MTVRRVLHLIDSWGAGGAETVFADLATGLDPTRFESFVALPRATGWLHDEMVRRGVRPHVLPSGGAFDLRHLGRLVALTRRLQIDLVQAHTFGTTVYASAAGVVRRTPVAGTFHGFIDVAISDPRRRIKLGALDAGASRIVCVSESLRRDLLTNSRLRPSRVAVIFNGVDTARFHPGSNAALRRELGIADDEFLIGAVGNVRRAKGYEILLSAASRLRHEGVRCRIVVAGLADGALYAELERLHAELGLGDAVRFIGFREDAEHLYRALDAYVLSSHSEGFSLSTVQALASGLPVVATRCGGPEEIITDGADGLLVPPGSADALAAALKTVVTDASVRGRVSEAGRRTADSRFSTRTMISRYESLYDEIAPVG